MATHAWIILGSLIFAIVQVARSYFQVRALRSQGSTLTFSAAASSILAFLPLAFMYDDDMIRFIFIATLVGIFAPYWFWTRKRRNSQASSVMDAD